MFNNNNNLGGAVKMFIDLMHVALAACCWLLGHLKCIQYHRDRVCLRVSAPAKGITMSYYKVVAIRVVVRDRMDFPFLFCFFSFCFILSSFVLPVFVRFVCFLLRFDLMIR